MQKNQEGGNAFHTTVYVTLNHKTSLKCQFVRFEIYTSTESWINKLSIDWILW